MTKYAENMKLPVELELPVEVYLALHVIENWLLEPEEYEGFAERSDFIHDALWGIDDDKED